MSCNNKNDIDNRVLVELKEILKYTDKDFLNKIPTNFLDTIDSADNSKYIFIYDHSKTLNEQNICDETKDILSGLYLMYGCDTDTAKQLLQENKKYNLDIKNSNNEDNNSNFKEGSIIVFKNITYIILKKQEKNNKIFFIVAPIDKIQEKWEDVKKIGDLNIQYNNFLVITYDFITNKYYFEDNENDLNELFIEILKNEINSN